MLRRIRRTISLTFASLNLFRKTFNTSFVFPIFFYCLLCYLCFFRDLPPSPSVDIIIIAYIANEQLIHNLMEHENISLYFSKKPGKITEKQVSRQDYAQ